MLDLGVPQSRIRSSRCTPRSAPGHDRFSFNEVLLTVLVGQDRWKDFAGDLCLM